MDALMEKSFTCNGVYTNNTGLDIVCHNEYGHGTQNIREAFANSCNPFLLSWLKTPVGLFPILKIVIKN